MGTARKLAESYAQANRLVQHNWFKRLTSFLDISSGSKCLDIGCGTGINTAYLADKVGKDGFVTGIDPDENRINIAKKEYQRENVNYVVGKSIDLPPYNGGYDLVISNAVMHWVKYEEKVKTYQRVHGLLKKDGVLAICEGASMIHNFAIFLHFLSPDQKAALPFHFLTIAENEKVFADIGFHAVRMEHFVSVDTCKSLDEFFNWSNATLNDRGIDFYKIYRENRDKIDITVGSDGTVDVSANLNFMILEKK